MQSVKNQENTRRRGKVDFELSYATPQDINAIEGLLYPHYFNESHYSNMTYDSAQTKETIASWLTETCILARVNGRVVGILSMYFMRSYYKELEGDVIIFYVLPEYRGTGVARGLVAALDAISKEKGAAIVYTSSGSGIGETNNKLYANLFKKFGFEELGTELIKKNG